MGAGREANATALLQTTATITAIACEAVDSLVAASDTTTVTFTVQPAPSVEVSLAITSDLPAAAFTSSMLASLGDALAAALRLPSWQVEVMGIRDAPGRRLLASLAVDVRILAATAGEAAAVQHQVAAANLTAVAAASGLPLTISSLDAQLVMPIMSSSQPAGESGQQVSTLSAILTAVALPSTSANLSLAAIDSKSYLVQVTATPQPAIDIGSDSINITAAAVSAALGVWALIALGLAGSALWAAARRKRQKQLEEQEPEESSVECNLIYGSYQTLTYPASFIDSGKYGAQDNSPHQPC